MKVVIPSDLQLIDVNITQKAEEIYVFSMDTFENSSFISTLDDRESASAAQDVIQRDRWMTWYKPQTLSVCGRFQQNLLEIYSKDRTTMDVLLLKIMMIMNYLKKLCVNLQYPSKLATYSSHGTKYH